ncbi:MAG: hypothetical protein MUC36_24960 [Planctomycetes bacterium]|jgi:hypothetical protein|nr:hypothetical protein [Planctomycetota bacterium]
MSNAAPQASGDSRQLTTLWARLRQVDRRLLALALLLPVLVAVWIPVLRPQVPAQPVAVAGPDVGAPAAAPLLESALPVALPAGSPAAIALLGRAVTAALAPYEPRWHPPQLATDGSIEATGIAPKPVAGLGAVALPELVPSAILLSPGGRSIAVVGGVPHTVGDRIGDHTLIAIEERSLRYRHGAEQLTVNLPDPGQRGTR